MGGESALDSAADAMGGGGEAGIRTTEGRAETATAGAAKTTRDHGAAASTAAAASDGAAKAPRACGAATAFMGTAAGA